MPWPLQAIFRKLGGRRFNDQFRRDHPLPKDFYAELVTLLRAAGCEMRPGGKGSHEKWWSPVNGRTFIVPRSKSRHTANEVLKQAGLPKSF